MTLKSMILAAALIAPATLAATTATAQVAGVAIADPQAAMVNTRAWTAARTQIQTTYKAQIDQAETRRQTAERELQPLITAFNTARAAPNANQASLQSQAQAIQSRQATAQQDLDRLTLPAQRAQAYALEQIQAQLGTAVQNAVRAKNVTVLLNPQAALFAQPTADITSAITAELDRLVPSVNTTPPANWQPGQQGAGAAPAAAGTPAPAATAPASNNRRNQSR
ncbi:OmpH family outer membrane protein [Sphingomonas aerophila]|uniref:Skp family chaperone for outer membrane proteins n=1 Tax=Sphingomonas aerophila TaxID=1344948 RepID=A0A7W9BCJ5_9SPHN|nr:OmpH family outer membrane protein [Sphingomonas aerophila]MBB5714693.1 Skp family chaperone for outer membrane proteins [Sphingomonas aerophila]